jgi:two-component sensor histidine kinase
LIHEKLYRSEGLARIDFKEYLESLTLMLLRAHGKSAKIRPEFHLQPVVLGIDIALPLGLIANELISNALKHAFAGRQNGLVRVGLCRHNDREFRLEVGDDGKGLPEDISQSNSLGVRLVRLLTGQIKGRMEHRNDQGAEFTVFFSAREDNAK